MAMPSMGSDFQLFSPNNNKRNSRDSQAESMSFAPSSTDEATQDWTQWMRWDDQGFAEGVKELSQSPFDLAFTSPNTSTGNPSTGFLNKSEFSPDISLDCTGLPFDSFFDRGYNSMTNSKGDSSGAEMPSTLSTAACSPLSPDGITRKRKSGSDDDGSTVSGIMPTGKKMPAKKRAHNVIEKRYRANLNDKIAELRDSVPSLRASKNAAGNMIDDDEGEGVTPASKLNKASILSKATEYIRHLEIRNKRLEEENTALKNRLRLADKAAEQMITSAASVSSPSNYTESGASSSPSVFSQVEDSPSDHSPTSLHPPEGMMKVPDAFKRLRDEAAAKNNAFSQSYIQYPSGSGSSSNGATQSGGGRKRSYYPNKYMLGALAGLMVIEGLGSEKESDSTAKGLLAVPVNLLSSGLQNPTFKYWLAMARSFWYSWHARAISHFLILATLVVGSAFVVFVYLFNAGPKHQPGSSKTAVMSDASLSSSSFRRQAWLTSIQQVGVPRHRFFREWYVVTSRCFEYVLRCLLGWKLYSSITGVTVEDDKGRVKSWDIAIDAQLAGGDPEISKSRLVLTIFAAGTLPRSPMRMMLKALHCRILLWRVGVPGSWTFQVSNDVARSLAGYQWDLARKMHAAMPKDHPDALPSHLAALLQLDCDEVMIDTVVQRAANLTWNRSPQEGADDDEALLDVVEEDPAIRSSLDALAAWWSSHILQRALLRYFEASSGGPDAKKSRDLFKTKIKIALDVAPQPSAAHTRALVMKAVFFDQDRAANIGAVLAALPKDKGKSKQSQVCNFLDSSLPVSVRDEIAISVRCAMIAAIFTARITGDTSLPATFTIQKAITWFNQLPLDPVDLTLIGFASVYHLLHVLASDTDYLSSSESSPSTPASRSSTPSSLCSDDEAHDKPRFSPKQPVSPQSIPNLSRVASELMYWARNAYNPAFYGFTPQLVKVIENECTSLCRSAGVDVADYSSVRAAKTKAKQVKEKKKKRHSRRA
ncbi:basic helix-loop-helix domain-containing protein [Aspergillus homomorphus CBS 101889]|uniref:HLH transcription factor n=1 Tax=Aspergillus homomorphus (strain CBS 101889) TaxID=1450537 RepID=A0A395I2C7_ASPHC|nr:HLH transcription factor [Aspergillus homomorphus CBS 101889]RAL14321.1 HLH transcription factor [Aspergillus homomorphus CBS 101889]